MGIQKQHLTFRFSEETLMQIDHIKSALAPFAEDRSSTLRIIINIVYAIIFTPTTLADVVAVMQRIHPNTLSHSQMTFQFPGQSLFRPKFGMQTDSES